jgi:hypothetical protein
VKSSHVIHIGYHKTASTWFQKRFYPQVRSYLYVARRRVQEACLHDTAFHFDPARARLVLAVAGGGRAAPDPVRGGTQRQLPQRTPWPLDGCSTDLLRSADLKPPVPPAARGEPLHAPGPPTTRPAMRYGEPSMSIPKPNRTTPQTLLSNRGLAPRIPMVDAPNHTPRGPPTITGRLPMRHLHYAHDRRQHHIHLSRHPDHQNQARRLRGPVIERGSEHTKIRRHRPIRRRGYRRSTSHPPTRPNRAVGQLRPLHRHLGTNPHRVATPQRRRAGAPARRGTHLPRGSTRSVPHNTALGTLTPETKRPIFLRVAQVINALS